MEPPKLELKALQVGACFLLSTGTGCQHHWTESLYAVKSDGNGRRILSQYKWRGMLSQ